MQAVNDSLIGRDRGRQHGKQDSYVYRASKDTFTLRAGAYYRVVKTYPVSGQLVLVQDHLHGHQIIVRYEDNAIRLQDGRTLKPSEWKLIGVVKPLDRFICASFPTSAEPKSEACQFSLLEIRNDSLADWGIPKGTMLKISDQKPRPDIDDAVVMVDDADIYIGRIVPGEQFGMTCLGQPGRIVRFEGRNVRLLGSLRPCDEFRRSETCPN